MYWSACYLSKWIKSHAGFLKQFLQITSDGIWVRSWVVVANHVALSVHQELAEVPLDFAGYFFVSVVE